MKNENERRIGETRTAWRMRIGVATEAEIKCFNQMREWERNGTITTNPKKSRK